MHPDHRRRGVGSALVHAVLGAADAVDRCGQRWAVTAPPGPGKWTAPDRSLCAVPAHRHPKEYRP
ncbi:GNAT family N-acetyltransferase [Streptomyces xanthophaeus]|uniref:GNAT family N-acetyltransferase n=1 Tax=Streptomyces xanthophaeus TaxID=67385 RepID=UPI0037160851